MYDNGKAMITRDREQKKQKKQRMLKFKKHRDDYIYKRRHDNLCCLYPSTNKFPIHWRFDPFTIKIFTYWPVPYYWEKIIKFWYKTHYYSITGYQWAFLCFIIAIPIKDKT